MYRSSKQKIFSYQKKFINRIPRANFFVYLINCNKVTK
ncbi:hypothetical protein [uncultured Gammaproteobacteria bacterium]|nr:hypothetical protein [uncultured Gammaproteobacteria bacterium]CAC9949765.1 hypothetical protein [uncultured Gammaproteobacteria bacterium]CAC9956112.1 hypothetical protein [uncultured Gammaproteobacteria bacterium]